MGLLDFFGKKSGPAAIKKHATRVANKRSHAADRYESLRALAEMKTSDAIAALLMRFTYTTDPTITDQEEKDYAYRCIVEAGEVAIEPARAFLRQQDSISWPMKVLRTLLEEREVVAELLSVLETMDTEYERDPQKKVQVLACLEDFRDDRIAAAVTRFLDDVNETSRLHACATLLAQQRAAEHFERLRTHYLTEESVRVRARILDGLIAADAGFEADLDAVRGKLPAGYVLDSKGKPRRRS